MRMTSNWAKNTCEEHRRGHRGWRGGGGQQGLSQERQTLTKSQLRAVSSPGSTPHLGEKEDELFFFYRSDEKKRTLAG